ncbi:MAG: hypothetical protein EPN69_01085, partial [Rhodanobacter sp.]
MAFALALVSAHAAAADATQDKPKATTQDKSSATNLGTVEVKGTSRQAILPTAATIDGPFGPGRSMLDTPRSVTPISADLMRATGVNNLRDIMKLAPDTYSPTDFGAP